MLDVMFYSKGTKPFGKKITCEWAMIFCEGEDYDNEFQTEAVENSFTKREDFKFEETTVFECDLIYDEMPDIIFKTIKNIVKENKPEVVLISKPFFFKKAVHFSDRSEMEPKMVIAENRDIVYYSMIGEDKSVLLVASESFEEAET